MSTTTAPHLRDKIRYKFHRHHEFPATYATTATVAPTVLTPVAPAAGQVPVLESARVLNAPAVTQVIQESGQPVETVRELAAETMVKDKAPVLRETVHVVEEEDIQPVVHLQRERTDVVHVTQPIHETQILPTKVVQGELPPEYRREMIMPGPPIMPAEYLPARELLAAERVQVVKPAVIEEVVKKTIVEAVQPFIERDIYEPHLFKQIRPIYERVVEAPILLTRMCPPIERGVVGYGDFAASDFIAGPTAFATTNIPATYAATNIPGTFATAAGPTSVTTTTTTTQGAAQGQLPIQQLYGSNIGQTYGGTIGQPYTTGQYQAGTQPYVGQAFGQGFQQQPYGANLGQSFGQPYTGQYQAGTQQYLGQPFGQSMQQQQPYGGNLGQPFGQGLQQQPLGNVGQQFGTQQPLGNVGQQFGTQQQQMGGQLGQQPLGNLGQQLGGDLQQMGGNLGQPMGGQLGQQGIQHPGQFLEGKLQTFQNIPQTGLQNLGGAPPSR